MFVDLRKVSREIRFYLICRFDSRVEKTLAVEEILLLYLENPCSYRSDVIVCDTITIVLRDMVAFALKIVYF